MILLIENSKSAKLQRGVEGESVPRGINLERNLNLGNSTRSRGDTSELELSKMVVVTGHGSLSLVDLDEDSGF